MKNRRRNDLRNAIMASRKVSFFHKHICARMKYLKTPVEESNCLSNDEFRLLVIHKVLAANNVIAPKFHCFFSFFFL